MRKTKSGGVEVDSDGVSGVRLADSKRLPARAVISNVNAPDTLSMLPETVRAAERTRNFEARLAAQRPCCSDAFDQRSLYPESPRRNLWLRTNRWKQFHEPHRQQNLR